MQVLKIEKDYQKQSTFNYFLCSDLHFGSKGQNQKLLKDEFDKAADMKCDIFINGDWSEFIVHSDKKRYSASADKYHSDNAINKTVREAYTFLKPYAKFIKMIGVGNHESSVAKFHSYDATSDLIGLLNTDGATISHGQSLGFINIIYKMPDKKRKLTFDIFYSHGQGKGSRVQKGISNLRSHMDNNSADCYWIGHTHTKLLIPEDSIRALDGKGRIYIKKRRGVITGCYSNDADVYDALIHGYQVNYGEEKCTSLQQVGGMIMTHTVENSEIKTKFIV